MTRTKKAVVPIGCAAALMCAAGAARAQDVAGVESTTLEEMMSGPHDLPGRVEGPRTPEPSSTVLEAASEPEERDWFGGKPWWKWERATGDWFGGRTWLEQHGITVDASYTMHWSSVWSGGVNNRASTRHLWDVNSTFDMDRLAGWKGSTFYADAMFSEVNGGSADVGDFQGISNIDTGTDRGQLSELWWEQRVFDDALRFKIGKIDANSEFAFVSAASDFVSSSPGVSPTNQGLPTYPDPATGVVVFGYPTKNWYIGAGFFDGATADGYNTGNRGPDTFFSDSRSASWFGIAETGLTWDKVGSLGRGRVAVGAEYLTARLDTFAGGNQQGSWSGYALVEQQLIPKSESEEDKDKGFFAFAQFGYGDDEVNPAKMHLACGCVQRGICESRADDIAGAYVSYVDLSDANGSPYPGNETSLEFFYQVQITPCVSVTPDLQVIFDPSGDSNIDTAVVGQLRLIISF